MDYPVVGLMSGTSLDGLDIAMCTFSFRENVWNYKLVEAVTIPFPGELRNRLADAHILKGYSLMQLDLDFGAWCGLRVKEVCRKQGFQPILVASHGHTVFHNPAGGISCQIGNGHSISVNSGIPVVCDFRQADVLMGGQGAPLVPLGDRILFSSYCYCLNIGGIANISFQEKGKRVAFDIAPANMVLNYLASRLGESYDSGGKYARQGELIPALLQALNQLPFYRLKGPKSLSREWVEAFVFPLLPADIKTEDLLHTTTLHIAHQIASVLKGTMDDAVLVTGGGAYNDFLLERIRSESDTHIEVPDSDLIEFKEALVFALLGLFRWLNLPNIDASVTGSTSDHCAGIVISPGL